MGGAVEMGERSVAYGDHSIAAARVDDQRAIGGTGCTARGVGVRSGPCVEPEQTLARALVVVKSPVNSHSTIRSLANTDAPNLPITRATTLAALDASQRTLFNRVVTGTSVGGVVALFLCAIGLYAIVAFAVSQRTREIGIRTALGADPREVVGMFFLRGVRLSVLGLAIGLGLSTIVLRLMTVARGEEMNLRVLAIAGVVAAVVVTVASVATWIPARRAATVDPLTMLRVE